MWFDIAPAYAGRPEFARDFAGFGSVQGIPATVVLAARLVQCWSTGAAQARALIRILHAAHEPHRPEELDAPEVAPPWRVISSSSHSYMDRPGTLWATIDSPVGLAEAICHEMAHHKLRALGVAFETARRIVANSPGERYPSPILGGRPRAMPALLHAHYALLHMVALDLEILSSGPAQAHPVAVALMRQHLRLLHIGDSLVWTNLVVDDAGAQFLPPVRAWQASLFDRSEVYR